MNCNGTMADSVRRLGPAGRRAVRWALIPLLGLCVVLAGCSSVSDILPDQKVDYKKQKVAEHNLEIPPDLSKGAIGDAMPVPGVSAGGSASYSEYEQQRGSGGQGPVVSSSGEVLPKVPHVRMLRDGDQRWLEIDETPDQVWAQVVAFWRQNGILLVEQDPSVGVMTTDWIENRADIKQGAITELFRKVLDSAYSAATRDQYRVRLERGSKPGTTDLYLTQRGMEEKLTHSALGESDTTFWVPRPNDPGLEAEMLRRVMVYLGVNKTRAAREVAEAKTATGPHARLVAGADGGSALVVDTGFAPAWRLVGVALERVGFMVEDRNRSSGTYYVRYDDPTRKEDRGILSKLAFWRNKPKFDENALYRVKLVDQGQSTRVVVRNAKGEPELSATGKRILTLIQEQIH